MEASVSIGGRLREVREGLGMNQTDFAALAGATRQTQSNYEKGERVPDALYLAAIAAAGGDVRYILTGIRESLGQSQAQGYAVAEAPVDPLEQRKQRIKTLIDQTDNPALLDALQDEYEKLERFRALGRAESRGGKKAG